MPFEWWPKWWWGLDTSTFTDRLFVVISAWSTFQLFSTNAISESLSKGSIPQTTVLRIVATRLSSFSTETQPVAQTHHQSAMWPTSSCTWRQCTTSGLATWSYYCLLERMVTYVWWKLRQKRELWRDLLKKSPRYRCVEDFNGGSMLEELLILFYIKIWLL